MNRGAFRWARWGVAVAIPLGVALNVALALSSQKVDLGEVLNARLALAFVLAVVPWAVAASRMVLWTRFAGVGLRPLVALRAALGGIVGSAVTPTVSGAGAIKWGLASRRGVPPGVAASLLAVETLEEAAFFAVALPLVALTASVEVLVVWETVAANGADAAGRLALGVGAVGAVVIGAALVGALALRGRLGRWASWRARRLAARLRSLVVGPWREARALLVEVSRRGRGWLVAGLGLTALQWGARYSVAWAVLHALDVPVPALLSWALQWLTQTAAGVVPTPGGAGGAEAAFALLYAAWVPVGVLGLAIATWRLTMYYAPLLLASGLLLLPWGRAQNAPAPGLREGSRAPGEEPLG